MERHGWGWNAVKAAPAGSTNAVGISAGTFSLFCQRRAADPAVAQIQAGTATFTVTATGFGWTQWRRAGEHHATLTIASAQSGDIASYDAVITNSLGSVTSAADVHRNRLRATRRSRAAEP